MKKILTLWITASLFSQEPAKPSPSSNAPILSMETNGKSILSIDAKARANDFVQAFEFLRKDRPSFKIMVRTLETIFSGVTDLFALPNGTLLIVKVLSNQGTKAQIIPVEQIVEISYSP